jgi:hypothetical protein
MQYVSRKDRGSAGGLSAQKAKHEQTNAKIDTRAADDNAFALQSTGVFIPISGLVKVYISPNKRNLAEAKQRMWLKRWSG